METISSKKREKIRLLTLIMCSLLIIGSWVLTFKEIINITIMAFVVIFVIVVQRVVHSFIK